MPPMAAMAAETSVDKAANDERPTPGGTIEKVGAGDPEVDERMQSTFDEK